MVWRTQEPQDRRIDPKMGTAPCVGLRESIADRLPFPHHELFRPAGADIGLGRQGSPSNIDRRSDGGSKKDVFKFATINPYRSDGMQQMLLGKRNNEPGMYE